jgi:phosphate transport system substrate-binding protein
MSQRNETPALLLSLVITAGLLAGGFWFFTQQRPNFNLGQNQSSGSQSTANISVPSSGNTFEQVQNVPTGLFSYGGSTSWAPIRLSVDSALQSARPGYRLRYVDPAGRPPSSTLGIKMLLDGQLDFAQSSRPITDQEYQQAQQRGFALEQVPIAIDGLAVAVNPNLNVSGVTLDQLKGIYTGRITNWNQVNGPNLPIVAFSRDAQSGGTVELLVEQVLGGQSLGSTVQIVPTTTQALQKVNSTPGGIYFASAPEVVSQCGVKSIAVGRTPDKLIPPYQEPLVTQCGNQRNRLNAKAFQSGEYPMTRNLFVIVKKNAPQQQAGEAYANLLLSAQGQDAIEKAGFIRIR